MKLFCPACDKWNTVSIEYYPTDFEINFEKINVIAGHVFCDSCGFELVEDDIFYQGMKAARLTYESLNRNKR